MSITNKLPTYDPQSKIQRYKNEDFYTIRLNQSGKGKLYEDSTFYYLIEDVEWKRPKEICESPYFIKETPDRFDVKQGSLGDGWLMAGIQGMTLLRELTEHIVPTDQGYDKEYAGVFHFRIWDCGTWYDIVVDDRLPVWTANNTKLAFAHSRSGDVFWASLLEKAYAKFYGSYENLKGGNSGDAMQDFTGGIVENVDTKIPRPGLSISWFLNRVFSNDALICCYSIKLEEGERDDLISGKVYGITMVFKCDEDDPYYPGLFLIRLRNPWGFHEWEGDWSDYSSTWKTFDKVIMGEKINLKAEEDGEFWMVETDFVKYFDKLCVCHLGPGQYLESYGEPSVKHWRTSTFWGEWNRGVSAGGPDISTRHENPQFRIQLERHENDDNQDGTCSVVIALTQKLTSGKSHRNTGFYVYSLESIDQLPMPLDYNFFNKHGSKNKTGEIFSSFRDVVARFSMKPGKYCIIPSTDKRGKEGEFLLRIFSESHVEKWEYDTKISKSLPNEYTINEAGKDVKKAFHDVSDQQMQIDWMGLKLIVETVMNNETRGNSMVANTINYLINIIWKCFAIFRRLSAVGDSNTGKIVFSKEKCRSMIAMMDCDYSGKLNFSEFEKLWNEIYLWNSIFKKYCKDTQDYMKASDLKDALDSRGYNINKETLSILTHYYSNKEGQISLDDFILCGIKLETSRNSLQEDKKITVSMEEWVKKTLYL